MTNDTGKTLTLKSPANTEEKIKQLKQFFDNGKTLPVQVDKISENNQKNKKAKVNSESNLLNKNAENQKNTSPSRKENDNKKRWQKRQEQLKKIYPVIDWLIQTYPACFSKEEPRPLKQGIHHDLFQSLPVEVPFAKILFRKALSFYTKSPKYNQAIIDQSYRIDLMGNLAEEIDSIHKQFAMIKLEANNQRKKKWKEFLNNKAKKKEKTEDPTKSETGFA